MDFRNGAKDGVVVRALASHQCGHGSDPGVDAICVLSLLLVLSFAQTVQSPLFFREIVEIQRVLPLMAAILILKCTAGAGVGDYSCRGRGQVPPKQPPPPRPLSSFDKHARWQPVRRAISRRSHGKIGDCEQSILCSERFFSGYSDFPLSSKTNISKFQFDQE